MRYTDYSKYPETCDIILPYYGFFGTSEGGFITAKHKKGKVAHDTFVFGKPGVLMQYTCLNAIGDVEVYEGDILEESRYGHSRGVVLFEDGEFIVEYTLAMQGGKWVKHNLGKYPIKNRLGFYQAYVAGNIYQNPDLLETI